ncbi:MAG: OmpH family outer membrane protein [Prevotellaceae bacterium]|jgi:outer membrane protein|nr:OmpH family outer membrane protein [Prevotellaceae bacterium]
MRKNKTVLLVALLSVTAMSLLASCRNKNDHATVSQSSTPADSLTAPRLPIAYINVDSLLLHYQFAKNANEDLIKEQESSRATLNKRMRELQQEVDEFQRKLENNAFLSRDRAEEEHNRLTKKDLDLQELSAKLQEQYIVKQQKMSEQLRDTINSFLSRFNKDRKYEMIISNTANDNILWANPVYDITDEVVEALNKRMKK